MSLLDMIDWLFQAFIPLVIFILLFWLGTVFGNSWATEDYAKKLVATGCATLQLDERGRTVLIENYKK